MSIEIPPNKSLQTTSSTILKSPWKLSKMEGFDDAGIFFSDNFAGDDQQGEQINLQAVKNKYKNFIRTFNEDNFHFKYR